MKITLIIIGLLLLVGFVGWRVFQARREKAMRAAVQAQYEEDHRQWQEKMTAPPKEDWNRWPAE